MQQGQRILLAIVMLVMFDAYLGVGQRSALGSQALDQLIRDIEPVPQPEPATSAARVPGLLQPPSNPPVDWAIATTAASAMACDPNRPPAIEAHWIGAMPWMGGNPITGGVTLFNSIGREILGSVESNLTPGQYVPVEIRFDPAETTFCQTFRIETNYGPAGVGVFPGSAWDISDPGNPRRLNLCFTEYNDNAGPIAPPNFFWDPDTTRGNPQFGKFEFVFIMLSDYDGTGLTYAGVNPRTTDQDMLYFWYPRLEPGHTWFETLPAAIQIRLYRDYVTDQTANSGDAMLTLQWTYCGDGLLSQFRILRGIGLSQPPTEIVVDVPAGTSTYIDTGLVNGTDYNYRIEVLGPGDSLMGYGSNFGGTPELLFQNMSLLGRWDTLNAEWGGIWGWVDPDDGREFALLCSRDGVRAAMIDLDVDPPQIVAELPGGFNDTKEIKTYLNYAFVLSEFGPITIYDLSVARDVYNPPLVGIVDPQGGGSHNLLIDGHYLYVVGNHGIGGVEIFDIINPAAPVKVGEFQPFYYHDVTIRRDTLYAYGIYGNGIDIINVSNKTAPKLISRFNYPGSGAHNGELSYDGKYLFIGDEIGSAPHTRIFDVSNPLNVSFVDDMLVDPLSISHNCYRKNNILYIAHYDRGVRAWDVSDPQNAVEVGFYDTNPDPGGGFDGCWTAYPMPSGRIIASDMLRGLFVLNFDGPQTPYCACACHGDPHCNVSLDIVDVVQTLNVAFRGSQDITDPGEGCPTSPSDLDCSDTTDITDVVRMINVVFRGMDPATEICNPCGP